MPILSPKVPENIAADPYFDLIFYEERQSFFENANDILRQCYPQFLIEDFIDSQEWSDFFALYPEFQFGLVEKATDKIVAQASCLTIPWDRPLEELPNTGCDWAFTIGLEAKSKKSEPTMLGSVSLAILPEYQGRGLSKYLLDYMHELARYHQFSHIILAVRPTLKHLYPLTPIERYIQWKNEAGFAFDPWLRMNLKQGAKLIGICDRSTTIIEPIAYWEEMTQIRFPETGNYIIPGAIVPLEIDCEANQGYYIEPNIWLSYQIS